MNHFLSLIGTNLRRNRIRSLIAITGISFGVAAMMSILSIVSGAIGMFERILSTDNHYLVFERNVSDLFFSSVQTSQARAIRDFENVEQCQPVLFGIVSSNNHPVITCFGVEKDNSRLQSAEWIEGNIESYDANEQQVFLGMRASEFLEAKLGENVQLGNFQFTVKGILKTENGFEDGGVFMPLQQAQNYFHRNELCSVLSIKLADRSKGNEFARAVESSYPNLIALENQEFSQSYSQFKIMNATSWAVGICACLLGGMGVANTMLMSVYSRIREIAILRVCGFSAQQVGFLIIGEGMVLGLIGAFTGIMIGGAILFTVQYIPQLQGYIAFHMTPTIFVGLVIVGFSCSILGSIYPMWKAVRIQAADALRYE